MISTNSLNSDNSLKKLRILNSDKNPTLEKAPYFLSGLGPLFGNVENHISKMNIFCCCSMIT